MVARVQLIAVFNARFTELSSVNQVVHFTAMILVAISIGLIMTPAAYHRQVQPRTNSGDFVRLASRLVAAALVPLMLGVALDIFVLEELMFPGNSVNIPLSLLVLLFFAGMWFGFPWWARRQKSQKQ